MARVPRSSPRSSPPADLLSLALAAHALGLSYSQAFTAMLKGRLEGHNINGRWFITRTSVATYAPSTQRPRRVTA